MFDLDNANVAKGGFNTAPIGNYNPYDGLALTGSKTNGILGNLRDIFDQGLEMANDYIDFDYRRSAAKDSVKNQQRMNSTPVGARTAGMSLPPSIAGVNTNYLIIGGLLIGGFFVLKGGR